MVYCHFVAFTVIERQCDLTKNTKARVHITDKDTHNGLISLQERVGRGEIRNSKLKICAGEHC